MRLRRCFLGPLEAPPPSGPRHKTQRFKNLRGPIPLGTYADEIDT
jgi:hypothetical protein